MKNNPLLILSFLFCTFYYTNIFSQDYIILNGGEKISGKVKQMDDTLVAISGYYNGSNTKRDYSFKRIKVKHIQIGQKVKERSSEEPVTVLLKSRKVIRGRIVRENENEYVITDLKKEYKLDTLYLLKSKVDRILDGPQRTTFVDIGFLRGGGALIGADIEFVMGGQSSIYVGGGLSAFGAGLNFFFRPGHRGAGIKFGINNQGFGDKYAGTTFATTFFYKSFKGISLDLGLARVINEGNSYAYKGYDYILWYGAGYRF